MAIDIFKNRKKAGQPFYEIKAADEAGVAEVFIYDVIGDSFFDSVSAKDFVEEINQLKDAETLVVRINSPGGLVFDGLTIYNALVQHPAKIITRIDGLAASAASIVALAGDTVEMADNAMFMIHNAWNLAIGDHREMAKAAEILKKIDGTLVTTYVAKTGLPEKTIRAFMDAETWFSAEEAHEQGFIDTVLNAAPVAALTGFDLSMFKNPPAALMQQAPEEDPEPEPAPAPEPEAEPEAAPEPEDAAAWRMEAARRRAQLAGI